MKNTPDKSALITILRLIGKFLPGDYLKTTFYLNVIAKPRKALRLLLNSFYRIDHIYDVLKEVKSKYKGKFSILEFGTADGYAFTKMLYATKYLKMSDHVIVHAFDSFEGMPAAKDAKDQDMIANDGWVEGQFHGNYHKLKDYCSRRYNNYQIHPGYFEESVTDEFLQSLKDYQPILVWIDCDYYSSAKTVFQRLIPYLPSGCVIYFDDYDFNYGSRFTGEARLIHEVNQGMFGNNIELVLDRSLSIESNRIYRFINFESDIHYERIYKINDASQLHYRSNDSPLP